MHSDSDAPPGRSQPGDVPSAADRNPVRGPGGADPQRRQAALAGQERERLLASERNARDAAERGAAELYVAIQAIPDAIYFGNEQGITRCNDAALRMFGAASLEDLQARSEELGRKFRARYERDGPPVKPQDLPFARALRGETAVLETWATQPDTGEDLYIRATSAPIIIDGKICGAVAVHADLTRQKRIETALRERDEQLKALIVSVRDYGIFVISVDGTIVTWNEGAELMTGYTMAEAIGMPYANLFTPEDRQVWYPEHVMAVAAQTGEYTGDGQRTRKDGSRYEAAVVLSATHGPQGELLGYLNLTRDVTERMRTDREREQLLSTVQAWHAEAARASRMKDEFLGTLSHELRTPLSAILGWSQVLARGPRSDSNLEKGLSAISRNARAQAQLIDDLLDMSRIESGNLRIEVGPVELPEVIARAVESLLPAAQAKSISVQTILDPLGGTVSGDAARLQQVVRNLLSNSVKFTPKGGRISVTLERVDAHIEVHVSDTGHGIREEFLPCVFDRFRQQDASTTRRQGGLGIGLSLVKDLVELHGGDVRAHSEGEGKGATFTVALPSMAGLVYGKRPARRAEDRREPLPLPPISLEGVRVLIVDDAEEARAIARRVLEASGAEVIGAGSAQEGLERLQRDRPHVILSDSRMPLHEGHEFLHWVRNLDDDAGGRTPAIAYMAFARSEDRQRALLAGYQSNLVKPVDPAELITVVASVAGRIGPSRSQK